MSRRSGEFDRDRFAGDAARRELCAERVGEAFDLGTIDALTEDHGRERTIDAAQSDLDVLARSDAEAEPHLVAVAADLPDSHRMQQALGERGQLVRRRATRGCRGAGACGRAASRR